MRAFAAARNRAAGAAALFALLALAGCDDATPGLAQRYSLFPRDVPPQLRLDDPADGTQVALARGQQLAVRLRVAGDSAFGWSYQQIGDAVLFPSGETPTLGPGDKPGADGTLQFTFRANRTGSGTIRFEHRPGWNRAAPPTRSFALAVTAH